MEVLNDDAMDFFSLSSAKNAHIYLNSILEAKNIRVSVSPALANHLWSGSFLWINHITPSGLASSVLTSESDIMQEALALECSTKFKFSDDDVTKLTETMVIFPTSVEDFLQRQKALSLLSCFFFEEHKMLPQASKNDKLVY